MRGREDAKGRKEEAKVVAIAAAATVYHVPLVYVTEPATRQRSEWKIVNPVKVTKIS